MECPDHPESTESMIYGRNLARLFPPIVLLVSPYTKFFFQATEGEDKRALYHSSSQG